MFGRRKTIEPGARFPELESYVQDACASFDAAVEAAGRGAWEMVDFHLMLLEEAAENVGRRIAVEMAAKYETCGF